MIGHLELIIILVVVFLIFGAKRLPDIAKSIGKGIREFRKALDGREAGEEKGGQPPSAPERNAPSAPERNAPSAPDGEADGKEGGNAPSAPERNAPSAPG